MDYDKTGQSGEVPGQSFPPADHIKQTAGGDESGPSGFKRPVDYFKITVFGFALAAFWAGLHTLIIPVRLLDMVPETQKNTYLGLLTFSGLLVAMAVQPIIGAFSDRTGFRFGRRRPYILLGTILTLVFLPGMGLAASYLVFFGVYLLLQVSANTAQGPFQALICDLVVREKRGQASGMKNLLEAAGGVIVLYPVGRFLDRYTTGGGGFWLWLTLGMLALILLGIMLYTVLAVRERPGMVGASLEFRSTLRRSFKVTGADPAFGFFLASRFLILVAFIVMQRYALFFLRDFIKVDNAVATTASLLIVIGICLLLTAYPAGYLADRVGRRPVVIASGLLGAVAVSALFFSHSLVPLMVAGGLLGIAFGGFMSASWALATELASESQEAKYLGLVNLATAGGGALVGLLGLAIDLLNADIPGRGYQIMLLFCLGCFLAGSVLVLKVRPRFSRNRVTG
ncbi:MAG: MFS transporter [Chloroflexota bacterium]